MSEYAIKPLEASTWDAFARLAEKHNGMCSAAAGAPGSIRGRAGRGRERSSLEGAARSRGEGACRPEANRTEELPDYRLTCIFGDRDYRRSGVAGAALRDALDLIAPAGGGVVEGYPQDTQGKKISAKFLYNTTRSLYEQTGFTYLRPKGKSHCVMRRTVSPARGSRRRAANPPARGYAWT